MDRSTQNKLAYLIGLAIGDGNLSNPNGRATRLRITCDVKYPNIIESITQTLQELFPNNKVGVVNRNDHCVDVSCYSNKLEELLGWKARSGSKYQQKVSIPEWILNDQEFTTLCLKGLFETDGSVYEDRGYKMVNFVTIIPQLSKNVFDMIVGLGFQPNLQTFMPKVGELKHTIRISKRAHEFIETINLEKS
jgi:DNA-binding transcriptional regulator WhiA